MSNIKYEYPKTIDAKDVVTAKMLALGNCLKVRGPIDIYVRAELAIAGKRFWWCPKWFYEKVKDSLIAIHINAVNVVTHNAD